MHEDIKFSRVPFTGSHEMVFPLPAAIKLGNPENPWVTEVREACCTLRRINFTPTKASWSLPLYMHTYGPLVLFGKEWHHATPEIGQNLICLMITAPY